MRHQSGHDEPRDEADEAEEALTEELLAALTAPPTQLPLPPVDPRAASLPLRKLDWVNFERLIVALVRDVFRWRDVRLYGVKGQAQHGIDLYGYTAGDEVRTCQVKDVKKFGKGSLRAAVKKFTIGKRPFESRWLAVVVACPVERTEILEELHELRTENRDLTLELWDQQFLSESLRTQHAMVRRFFGPEWERIFCEPLPILALPVHAREERQRRLEELRRESQARLITRWVSAGLEEEQAEAFAEEVNLGMPHALSASLPEKGLILLEGDFGSGKSTAGERLHQGDLERALADVMAPVPVYLTARYVCGPLKEAVLSAATGLGDPSQVGARIVLDGIDEPGLSSARNFLEQARVLVRHWPHTRCLLTARPFDMTKLQERVHMPLLNDVEVRDLVKRVAGVPCWTGWPSSVWEAARRPLFALVAASLRNAQGRPIPRTAAEFLDALIKRALERSEQMETDAHVGLQRLAALTLTYGGFISSGEFGAEPDIQRLLTTRLVVRRGRTLAFSLPIIEQYFGGQAILGGAVKVDTALASLESFERWREAMVLAVGFGSWERVSSLLTELAGRYPGAAAWVVQKALSERSFLEQREDAPDPDLPAGAECVGRLLSALAVWTSALRPLCERTWLVGANDGTLTLAARSEGTRLIVSAWRTEDAPALVLGRELPREWKSPLHQDALWKRSELIASAESAWPWKVSLMWLREEIERVLSSRALSLRETSPGRAERRWALARTLMGMRKDLLHAPIPANVILTKVHQALASLGDASDTSSMEFGCLGDEHPSAYINELRDFASDLKVGRGVGPDGLLRRPWTVPDRPPGHDRWIWSLYGHDAQLRLVQEVYQAALDIYEELVTTWMPKLRSTMGWACVSPILLKGILEFGQEDAERGRPTLHYHVRPLPIVAKTTVVVTAAPEGFEFASYAREYIEDTATDAALGERSPEVASWFRQHHVSTVVRLYGNTPALDLAYTWLADHLQALSLVSFGYRPPSRD